MCVGCSKRKAHRHDSDGCVARVPCIPVKTRKKPSVTAWGTLAGPWTPVSEVIRLSGYVGSGWFTPTVRIVNIDVKKTRRAR